MPNYVLPLLGLDQTLINWEKPKTKTILNTMDYKRPKSKTY